MTANTNNNDTQIKTSGGSLTNKSIGNHKSDNKEARIQALWKLYNHCWHERKQLNRNATFLIPLIVERLEEESEPEILDLILFHLAHLATGHPGPPTRAAVQWVFDTYDAIYEGLDIYLDLLAHPSPQVRIAAAYTLSCCKSEAVAGICTHLCRRFGSETDMMVKSTILLCLAFLSVKIPVSPGFFESILNSKEEEIVKLAGVCALASVTEENMPDYACDLLVHLWSKPELLQRLANHYDGRMVNIHYKRLLSFIIPLGDRHAGKMIPVLWKGIQYDQVEAIDLAFPNMTYGMGEFPEGTRIHNLTENQQLVLRLIADTTKTGQESIYRRGILKFIGIGPVSPSDGYYARKMLKRFLNGAKVKYDQKK